MADSKIKKLEEQMTCSVCLGIYNEPKTLPCLHSYCQSCLEGITVLRERDYDMIACPQCRTLTPLPQIEGVKGFVNSHHIASLKELHSYLTKTSNVQQIICEGCNNEANIVSFRCKDCGQYLCTQCTCTHKEFFLDHRLTKLSDLRGFEAYLFPTEHSGNMCLTHSGQPCDTFCEECSEIICKQCSVESHKGHFCDTISDSYHKHAQMLEAALNPVTEGVRNVEAIISGERDIEICEQADDIKRSIDTMAEEMIDNIRNSEENLKQTVDEVVEYKLGVISAQKKAAQTALIQLQLCQQFVEDALKGNPSEEALDTIKILIDRMNKMSEEIDIKAFEPKEDANIKLIKDRRVMESLNHLGDVVFYSPSLIKECKINVSHINRSNNSVMFSFGIEYLDSSFVTVHLSYLRCTLIPPQLSADNASSNDSSNEPSITCVVTNTVHPGMFRVNASPVVRGVCSFNVDVDDFPLPSVPLVIPFSPSCDDASHPVGVIVGLSEPNGIIVSDEGHIIVTENSGSCITIFDKNRVKIKTFSQEECGVQFIHPRGMVLLPSENSFLVLDDHRVRKMTMDGQCIASVGNSGSVEPLHFSYPGGITISPNTGNIWITDYCNNRVQVLNSDMTFLFSFGVQGIDEGQFNGPTCVAIDKYKMVYVVDCNNHRIQIFTEEGSFVSQFGNEGSEPGQLCNPFRIILDEDRKYLYITEYGNHRVSIFTTDGILMTCFDGDNQFDTPCGIELDKEGYLYICDSSNGRVLIY